MASKGREDRKKSTLPTTTSKLRALWSCTLGHVTLGLRLLCLGQLCFLRLLFILGFLDPLLNFTEKDKADKANQLLNN